MSRTTTSSIIGIAFGALILGAVSCGGSGASTADAGGATTGPAGDGLFATIGGTPISFTQTLANSQVFAGRKFLGQAPSNSTRPPSLQVTIPTDATGTYDCKTAPAAAVMHQVFKGTNTDVYLGNDTMGSCSVVVTSVAKATGERWKGTFEATLVRSGGTETLPLTNGSFVFTRN